MSKSYLTTGIVLKRTNYSEADRIVTLFTKEHGKVVGLAKGVRKITSKRASAMEPATVTKFMLHPTKGMDIITQTHLLDSFPHLRQNLIRLTQTQQLLEIIDLLTVEQSPTPEVFDLVVSCFHHLKTSKDSKKLLLTTIHQILGHLGFVNAQTLNELKLKNYIESLTERRLRAKSFLTPNYAYLKTD
jgi:DNA repair protein RecO (recombination protein O)